MLKYTTCDRKMIYYIYSQSLCHDLASMYSKFELKQLCHQVCLDNSCLDYTTIQLSDDTNVLN